MDAPIAIYAELRIGPNVLM